MEQIPVAQSVDLNNITNKIIKHCRDCSVVFIVNENDKYTSQYFRCARCIENQVYNNLKHSCTIS